VIKTLPGSIDDAAAEADVRIAQNGVDTGYFRE